MAGKRPVFKVVPEFFDYFPAYKWTYEIAKIAVERNGWNLQFIPSYFITRELCDIAVKNAGAIEFVPPSLLTLEDCKIAVRLDYTNLAAVPARFLTKKFIEFAVKSQPLLLTCLRKEVLTAALCKEAFKGNPIHTFNSIPQKFVTKEMCEEMVLRGNNLKDVPDRLKSLRICLLALLKDPGAIEHIPDCFLTQEMCNYAVAKKWEFIKHVPQKFKTRKLCCEAIRHGEQDALEFIPEAFIEDGIENEAKLQRMQNAEKRAAFWNAYDEEERRLAQLEREKASSQIEQIKEEEFEEEEPEDEDEDEDDLGEIVELMEDVIDPLYCIDPESVIDPHSWGISRYLPKNTKPKIVKKLKEITNYAEPPCLGDIPFEYITPQLCENLVIEWGKELQFVPEYMKTPEMCRLAVRSNGEAIYYVPQEFIDEDLILLAIRHSKKVFRAIPDEVKTPRMCNQAVQCQVFQIMYVPEKLATSDMAKRVVQWDVYCFRYIPQSLMTPEICKLAVRLSGRAMEYIPNSIKTKDFCDYALRYHGTALKGMPTRYKTPKVCAKAFEKGPGNGPYYISDWRYILEGVPKKLRTKEFCEEAVSCDGEALALVPQNLKTVEMCSSAILNNGSAIRLVPQKLRDQVIDNLVKLSVEKIKRKSEIVENDGWDPDFFNEMYWM